MRLSSVAGPIGLGRIFCWRWSLKLLAFLKRDLLSVLSYRLRVLLGFGSMLVSLLMFYFIGRTFGGAISPYLERYGGEYFPYVFVGIAVSSFVTVGLHTLSSEIRSAQVMGTLEYLLSTPTSIYTVLIGNSLYTFLTAFAGGLVFIVAGALWFDMRFSFPQFMLILLVLMLTFVAFLAIGMLSASFIMVFKEGNPIDFLFGTSSYFLGGVFFPVEVLPKPFRFAAQFIPITHAVTALRELLLARAALGDVFPTVLNLVLFIAVLAPISISCFHFAVRRAKINGSLVQY